MGKCFISIVFVFIMLISITPNFSFEAEVISENKEADLIANIPLHFVKNMGQIDASVKYYVDGGSFIVYFEEDKITYAYRYGEGNNSGIYALKQKILGCQATSLVGVNETPSKFNSFIGSDSSKWRTDIPSFEGVLYENVYPGIDLYFYGDKRNIKYEFVVNSNPKHIRMIYEGQERLGIDENGNLRIETPVGTFIEEKPYSYQIINGEEIKIECSFVIDVNEVRFNVGNYDSKYPLIIDPLIYSTYVGGPGSESGDSIAVDSDGNAYVTGVTFSPDFPTTPGASPDFPTTPGSYQNIYSGGQSDAFVLKLNTDGTELIYSTYIGGASFDAGYGIVVDSDGNAYVTGNTQSANFPTTPGAYQTELDRLGAAFVIKLNEDGTELIYSTFIGGIDNYNDEGREIEVDSNGNAYVTGYTQSTNFPTTVGAYQTTHAGSLNDAFVLKLNTDGTELIYSTFIGGSGNDGGYGIVVDSNGNAYVTGVTFSPDFPTTPGAYQTILEDTENIFILKLSSDGTDLIYSTVIGGTETNYGEPYSGSSGIVVDSNGNAYVTGSTNCIDFPTTPGSYQTNYEMNDAFVLKLNSDGSDLIYSTFLSYRGGSAITVDTNGNAYVTGTRPNGYGFLSKINSDGSDILYNKFIVTPNVNAQYFSDIVLDNEDNIYITGGTTSGNFPTTPGAYQTIFGGRGDVFILKESVSPAFLSSSISAFPSTVVQGESITIYMTITNIGDSTATNVVPSSVGISGTGSVTLVSGPFPSYARLTGGSQVTFAWAYTANDIGTVTFSGNASADGGLSSSSTDSNEVTIQSPASLSSSITASPSTVVQGNTITVTMTVSNSGDSTATNVVPSALDKTETGSAAFASGPTPSSKTIAGHSEANFTWTYTAGDVGTVTFSGNASADGGLSSSSTDSNEVTIYIPNRVPYIVENFDEIGIKKSNIVIPYALYDEESDICSISVEYYYEGNWYTATEGLGSDGRLGLPSSPSGISHIFVWDSGADAPNSILNKTKIRIKPNDGAIEGPWTETEIFNVNNKRPDPKVIFDPIATARLKAVKELLAIIEPKLPENSTDEIEKMMDEAYMHIENASKSNDEVYISSELNKAKKLLEKIEKILDSS